MAGYWALFWLLLLIWNISSVEVGIEGHLKFTVPSASSDGSPVSVAQYYTMLQEANVCLTPPSVHSFKKITTTTAGIELGTPTIKTTFSCDARATSMVEATCENGVWTGFTRCQRDAISGCGLGNTQALGHFNSDEFFNRETPALHLEDNFPFAVNEVINPWGAICAVDYTRTDMYCLGRKSYTGGTTTESSAFPIQVPLALNSMETIVSVKTGSSNMGFITSESRVFLWGSAAQYTMLTTIDTDTFSVPTLVALPDGRTPLDLFVGNAMTVVLLDDKTLYGGGSNLKNALGHNDGAHAHTAMILPNSILPDSEVPLKFGDARGRSLPILSEAKNAFIRGGYQYYECKTNFDSTFTKINSVDINGKIDQYACNYAGCSFLLDDGKVFACGREVFGFLVNGTETTSTKPVDISAAVGEVDLIQTSFDSTFFFRPVGMYASVRVITGAPPFNMQFPIYGCTHNQALNEVYSLNVPAGHRFKSASAERNTIILHSSVVD